jgi:hypothetical protein
MLYNSKTALCGVLTHSTPLHSVYEHALKCTHSNYSTPLQHSDPGNSPLGAPLRVPVALHSTPLQHSVP